MLTPEEAFTKENICRIYHLTAEEYTFLYGPDAAVQTPAPQAEAPKKPRPKFEHYVRSGQKLLRCGYTTGTCAALGAAGAARLLLTGQHAGNGRSPHPKRHCGGGGPAGLPSNGRRCCLRD